MKLNKKQPFVFFAVIAIAIVVVIVLVSNKPRIKHKTSEIPRIAVDVITIKKIPYRVKVTGYGNVVPAITLKSMAEVSGKVDYVHPQLKSGEAIQAGTLVVKIDAKDYAISLKQSEADLAASRASLSQLAEEEKSTLRSIALTKKNLEVGQQEFTRMKGVYEKEVISKSMLDAEEQKLITLRQQLEEMQGKINAFDSRKRSLQAQMIRAEREVENRQTIMARTEIKLPFNARIGEVKIEKNEFVSTGSVLFEAIDLEGVEITAQIPLSSMRKLVSPLRGKILLGEQLIVPGGRFTDRLKLKATVSLVNDLGTSNWEAKVLRISEAVDATRQTLGIVVGVEKPYQKAIPGKKPPLLKGMYTAVHIFGEPRDAIVVPRKAIHQGRVYIVDKDEQLKIREVIVEQVQGEIAIVEQGLEEGERIIITDVFPVIESMPVKAGQSVVTIERIAKLANGDAQ